MRHRCSSFRSIRPSLRTGLLATLALLAAATAPAQSLRPGYNRDVIYQVFVDRFFDGTTVNNYPADPLYDGTGNDLQKYQGGDFQGLTSKINYLRNMGVTAIWVTSPLDNRNLQALAERFPKAELHGVDLSADMLDQAGKRLAHCSDRLKLHHSAYAGLPGQYDLIVASYLLSMVGPGLDQLLADASDNLSARGRIAVVDFRDTPKPWFRRWMGLNHVHLDDRLLPRLKSHFRVQDSGTRCAYGGLWRWFWFVGGR